MNPLQQEIINMQQMFLKPCPFCGGKAIMWSWNGGTQIQCENYADKHLVAVQGKTTEEAIERWNERE